MHYQEDFCLMYRVPRGMLIRAVCFKFSKDKFDLIFGEEKQVLSASNSQYGRALYYCVHVVIYASKRWRQVGSMYISQSLASIFCPTLSSSHVRTTQIHKEIFYSNFITILLYFKSQKLSRFCHIGHCLNCLCLYATFRHRKRISDKNIHQKINISLPASIMTGD